MLGVFLKIQEICSQIGTKILKIDWEMSEIIELKVGNPKIQSAEIEPFWATPNILIFLWCDELFSYLYGSKVPKWNFAHILQWKKAKNIRKTPKKYLFYNSLTEDNLTEWPGIWRQKRLGITNLEAQVGLEENLRRPRLLHRRAGLRHHESHVSKPRGTLLR